MASAYGYGLSSSLRNLRDDIGNFADEIATLLKDNTEVAASDVKQRVERLRDDLDDMMSETSAKGRELVEWARLDGVADSIEDTIRARPWTMMAVVAGLGLLASQAWPSAAPRRSRQGAMEWTGKAASDLYERTRDNIGEAISQTSSKAGELMEQAHLDGMTGAVGKTLRDRPWMMMAVAAGLGVIASQAWNASHSNGAQG